MAILPIRHYPDPVLKQTSAPIQSITEEIRTLVADMADTMYAAPGVGLAAPQVGINKNLIIIDCSPQEEKDLIVAINPEIIARDGESFEEEGCLSVPGYYARIERSARVKVRYLDLAGQEVVREASGLLAIAFQHEIDHLHGLLFVDHLSSLKKGMFRKKYEKLRRQQEHEL
ncbi:MAG: peptide deformylase [Syntrophotalea acetylenica]|jgi:peptide deformylase|uniref:Peptide deformylase n=1 Tax=Syntrophotalea acetylenica TaxID=29542 RepID=A0A1L3GF71_SYNAC|nr:peptide deformylase [Syntrophotalea acetylenica]APG24612.1 peptide deformylase [Syntrophotalea acetylenica]APG45195.1 peptide deformylase [Syntrophotalea acetylenica]MDD4456912.1 peptide deformylase [Syntrophotalea acetylenica]MDY0262233.1 peptide deformylase [Syntrophotalea acetylenica]